MKKLCVLAALLLMAGTALAETPALPLHVCGDFTYVVLEDGTAQIVDWEGTEAELMIPEALDGLVVTSIGECAFADCGIIRAVTLPGTVAEIGEEAFSGCLGLEQVSLSSGLERIGSLAFKGCEGLTVIALPGTVSDIGENPFMACDNLYDIIVAPDSGYLSVVDGVLFSRPDSRLVCFPMGLPAERYVVPDGVETIGAMAFNRDLYLEEVVLPDSLRRIEHLAFNGCEALRTMNLPAGVTSIGEGAMLCSNLTLTVESEGGMQYAMADADGDGA